MLVLSFYYRIMVEEDFFKQFMIFFFPKVKTQIQPTWSVETMILSQAEIMGSAWF